MFLTLTLIALGPPAAEDADRFARWEKEIAAIEKRLKDAPPKEGGVVFAGSSSIRLWDLKTSFPDRGYVNVGFGGAEVRDVAHFAARIVAPHKPGAVVFYAGDNDVASGRKPGQVLADFRAFCAAVHKDVPKCRVLFLSIKPSVARWKRFDDQKKTNSLVKEFCATDPRLAFVDVVPAMLGPDGTPAPELFAKDGLHLSPAGYEKWTAAVAAALGK
ncbi:MAG: GDSL-like Lipase/Acylhydrolase [Gemmataceae bacterium]|nr:GDSL-like Lipase/Acylhydrolase [Gemmataceae bacterium]